jgi:hypothetical protein
MVKTHHFFGNKRVKNWHILAINLFKSTFASTSLFEYPSDLISIEDGCLLLISIYLMLIKKVV